MGECSQLEELRDEVEFLRQELQNVQRGLRTFCQELEKTNPNDLRLSGSEAGIIMLFKRIAAKLFMSIL